MDEPYRIEVLHIINPHLMFVESQEQKGKPVIQQLGIYGVLPVYKTVDIDGEITAERCENWPVAANTILREFLAEHKNHVYFVPIHVDDRSTIFDENIHQFGDIIIKHRTTLSITDHLIQLAVAVKDEPNFLLKLASGSLKLKLNTARTDEVLTAIEKYYMRKRKVDHDWQKTIKKQTSLHQETKKITALTEENLKLLERSSQGINLKDVMKTIELKEKDFNLCKDANLVSVGCGSRRSKSHSTSTTSKINGQNKSDSQEIYDNLKQFLVTHGKKKNLTTDSVKPNTKEIGKQSMPKKDDHEKQINTHSNSVDSDGEWDCIETSKAKHYQHVKGQLHQRYHNKETIKSQSLNIQSKSQEQTYSQDEQNDILVMKLSPNKLKNSIQNSADNYQSKIKQRSDSEALEKSPKHMLHSLKCKEEKVSQHHENNKATRPLKPKERRLVYCPDMEMNDTNLKKLVAITITETSAANYGNNVEEDKGNTTIDEGKANVYDNIHNDDNFDDVDNNVCNIKPVDTLNQQNSHKSHFNTIITENIGAVKNTGLNSSILKKKLLALKSVQKHEDSVSSSSDVSDQNTTNTAAKLKSIECKNTETETRNVCHSETKHIKSSFKANRTLSSSILQKKWQAHNDLQNRKANSSSTSDTSVKDSSSTEQSKTDPDEPDKVKVKPEPSKVDPPKLPENFTKIVRNVNPFKNLDGSKSVFVAKLVAPILMVHTKNNNLILPQCEMRDIPFKPDIRMTLKSMRIQKPKRLQTVAWTYILRGHSMFIIGPAGNGKTVGYVPAICNLVVDSSTRSEGVGPICIIVCATALSVSEVESHCKRFLGVEERIVSYFPGIDPTKTTTALLNGCHVLICTAPALVTLLETDFGVDLRRLAALVLDDCERLSQVYAAELTRIIQNVKAMLKNRGDKALKVQYIVASRQWCDFMTPLAKKAPDTVIAIGASQECVLYSKTKTSVNFVKSQENKVNTVVEFLEEIDRTKKTVIVCREDEEVIQLEKTLSSQKHVVFSCNSQMDLHELCRLNEAWANYEEPVLGPILICCDGNLTHLNITNANYLVHFSMPALFSVFCKRFSVLNENYASIFEPERVDVKIKILLDETNVEQLPKILHFVNRCTKEGFPNLDNVLQEVLEAKDLKKAENLNPICNNMLMLGECADMWTCSDRHTVFKEFDEPKDWMPKQGLITFKITHYDTAVTYSGRVLAKITEAGPVKFPNNYNTLSLKMGMHYSKEINRKLHGEPKVGDICAVALKQNFFERCRVMKVIPSDRKNTNHVLINLIDEEQMTVVSDVLLYYLPDDLKAIETYVVKVRLANVQPKDKDVTFSLAAKDHLQKLTDREREHGLYMRGQVVMTLGNTIFVDTAEACVDLSSLGETVVKQEFKKELLDRHADPNPQHIEKLKKISGMINTVDLNKPKVTPKVQKCPKWAHLSKDDFSTVILTAVVDAGTILLRHTKFHKVVDSLLKDIKEYVEKAPEVDQEEIYTGNIVLAEFPDDATYERARIDGIVNDKIVNCFFVDTGDWGNVSINKLKPITDNIMHRIPFQAIECRLIGVKPPGNADVWPGFSTCWIDDNCFQDKDGNQKQLFVKYFTKEAATTTGGHKYGVVLIDTYSKEDVVINKMMIELNLAKAIEDEEKYINEPLDVKRVNVADSSSDISDKNVTEEDNCEKSDETPATKDLACLRPKENENNESNDIPLHILLGKPIRSVPLVNSDSDSDISDKWDVNVDKDLLGMFGMPSKANITQHKTTNNYVDKQLQTKNTDEKLEKDDTITDLDITNENTKESSDNSIASSLLQKENDGKKSPPLDSDDTNIGDETIHTLDDFTCKISKEDVTKKTSNTITENESLDQLKNNTLDSDDLSFSTETSEVKVIETEPPRKPKLVWRQNKNSVAIKINLIGVEDYTLELQERHINFQTWHNDTRYKFEFDLYGVVVPDRCVHSNKGQYIQVKLVKMLSRNWLSLTKDFSTKKWIVYDVDAIDLTSDEEDDNNDEARKVIKHNHEKVDSSSDDDDFADDMNFKYKRH